MRLGTYMPTCRYVREDMYLLTGKSLSPHAHIPLAEYFSPHAHTSCRAFLPTLTLDMRICVYCTINTFAIVAREGSKVLVGVASDPSCRTRFLTRLGFFFFFFFMEGRLGQLAGRLGRRLGLLERLLFERPARGGGWSGS